MPQVLRRIVNRQIWQQIYSIFIDVIKKGYRKEKAQLLIDFLLTETEKIMLAKRLAIALLLESGFGYEQIKTALKVSQGTIATVKIRLSVFPEYRKLIDDILIKEELKKEFWQPAEILGKTFSLGKGGKFWREIAKRAREKRKNSIFNN